MGQRNRTAWAAALALLFFGCNPAQAVGWLFAPCAGDCALTFHAGSYVEDDMADLLILGPEPPWNWDYRDDKLAGVALSRRLGTLWGFEVEAEGGLAKRFGRQDEVELWAAAYMRYRFPWDRYVVTTFAVSSGLNYATDISEVERERAKDGEGSRLMHFFSPEITLALPSSPDHELVFRFHHRSGVYGLISEAHGGAQYGTVGLRFRF